MFLTPFHTQYHLAYEKLHVREHSNTILTLQYITNHYQLHLIQGLFNFKQNLFIPCTEKSRRERSLPRHLLSPVNCLKMY